MPSCGLRGHSDRFAGAKPARRRDVAAAVSRSKAPAPGSDLGDQLTVPENSSAAATRSPVARGHERALQSRWIAMHIGEPRVSGLARRSRSLVTEQLRELGKRAADSNSCETAEALRVAPEARTDLAPGGDSASTRPPLARIRAASPKSARADGVVGSSSARRTRALMTSSHRSPARSALSSPSSKLRSSGSLSKSTR